MSISIAKWSEITALNMDTLVLGIFVATISIAVLVVAVIPATNPGAKLIPWGKSIVEPPGKGAGVVTDIYVNIPNYYKITLSHIQMYQKGF